jgi:response regulator RpfG family c-di-GMP phosphodiesterase
MTEKILFVDDDENLLAGVRRSLRGMFHVDTAVGGPSGLERIGKDGPYAVVLADMKMPGMDGITFLAQVKELVPDTVRVMLTGNADQDTAIGAVNQGHIFRFLTKPCPKECLAQAIEAALDQHRLIVAEKQLLEGTLNSSVKILTDILAIVNPMAFGRANRIRQYARYIAGKLGLKQTWRFEVAAMLSQLGCVTLSAETIQKLFAGAELNEAEKKSYYSHPELGGRMIAAIPRMEEVGHMIARQQEPCAWGDEPPAPHSERDAVAVGGQILKVSLDFDHLMAHGFSSQEALARMDQRPNVYDPVMVALLRKLDVKSVASARRMVCVGELTAGMVLDEDVYARNGRLLVTKGQQVTYPICEHLLRWAAGAGVKEPFRVVLPEA